MFLCGSQYIQEKYNKRQKCLTRLLCLQREKKKILSLHLANSVISSSKCQTVWKHRQADMWFTEICGEQEQ